MVMKLITSLAKRLNPLPNEEFGRISSSHTGAVVCLCFCLLMLCSCARMGSPDGGWYDDTPPRVVSATPADCQTNVKTNKVIINFSEFIKIEDAQNKVIVSPPQIEMPEIKASGKRIIVELKDTLKENTTYTVDFSDAISDNNEGNPMGNYTYSFSTGDHIDTLEVSGYCLDASNLEPIKGMLVGLYRKPEKPDAPDDPDNPGVQESLDSTFHKEPMMRVSRTNSSGRFTIKGIAAGDYVVRALQDADGDYVYGQKSEMIGYSNDAITPTWKPDTRMDTLWLDTLHIDNIIPVPYTHFMPDDVTLLCFKAPQTDRYLVKTERKTPEHFDFFFSYGNDSLPDIKGLNFDADSAFIIEASEKRDSIVYWLRDTTLVNQDTLRMEVTYYKTDTTGVLALLTDTLEVVSKISYDRRVKERQKEVEKWQKEQEKRKKKGMEYDSIMPPTPLKAKLMTSGQISPIERVLMEMPEPLERCDTSAIHLYVKIDSTWYRAPHEFVQLSARMYELKANWQEGTEYSFEIDSAAIQGIYGQTTNALKEGIKVRTIDDFSTLTIDVSGTSPDDSIVVQLLDASDKPLRSTLVGAYGKAVFNYLKPGTYYMRAFIDSNANGVWDTGDYDQDLQAEAVYYFNEEIECKAKWDVKRKWNLTATPRYRQKPEKIVKQKPEKQKQVRNRNAERAKQLGLEYVRGTTGM